MENIQKQILQEMIKICQKNDSILSLIIRGSYVEEKNFNENNNDIDFSVIIKKNTLAKDILDFKKRFKKISEKYGLRVSSTVLEINQVKKDLEKGFHLHGSISSSFIFQLSRSPVIYGEDFGKLFSSFKHYDPYTPYFNAVRFADKVFNDYLQEKRNNKGINYSFILARECMVTKGIITSNKNELIRRFKTLMGEQAWKNLEKIKTMRKKKKLSIKDLEIIYSFLKYCRDYLGSFLGKNLKDLKKLNKNKKWE